MGQASRGYGCIRTSWRVEEAETLDKVRISWSGEIGVSVDHESLLQSAIGGPFRLEDVKARVAELASSSVARVVRKYTKGSLHSQLEDLELDVREVCREKLRPLGLELWEFTTTGEPTISIESDLEFKKLVGDLKSTIHACCANLLDYKSKFEEDIALLDKRWEYARQIRQAAERLIDMKVDLSEFRECFEEIHLNLVSQIHPIAVEGLPSRNVNWMVSLGAETRSEIERLIQVCDSLVEQRFGITHVGFPVNFCDLEGYIEARLNLLGGSGVEAKRVFDKILKNGSEEQKQRLLAPFTDPARGVFVFIDPRLLTAGKKSIADLVSTIAHERHGHGFFVMKTAYGVAMKELGAEQYSVYMHQMAIGVETADVQMVKSEYRPLFDSSIITQEGFSTWMQIRLLEELANLEKEPAYLRLGEKLQQQVIAAEIDPFGRTSSEYFKRFAEEIQQYAASGDKNSVLTLGFNPYKVGYRLCHDIALVYGEKCVPRAVQFAGGVYFDTKKYGSAAIANAIMNDGMGQIRCDPRLFKIREALIVLGRQVTEFEKDSLGDFDRAVVEAYGFAIPEAVKARKAALLFEPLSDQARQRKVKEAAARAQELEKAGRDLRNLFELTGSLAALSDYASLGWVVSDVLLRLEDSKHRALKLLNEGDKLAEQIQSIYDLFETKYELGQRLVEHDSEMLQFYVNRWRSHIRRKLDDYGISSAAAG